MRSSCSVFILLLFFDGKLTDSTSGPKIFQIGEDCISVEVNPDEEEADNLELAGIYR